jgi:hypothetical protein
MDSSQSNVVLLSVVLVKLNFEDRRGRGGRCADSFNRPSRIDA